MYMYLMSLFVSLHLSSSQTGVKLECIFYMLLTVRYIKADLRLKYQSSDELTENEVHSACTL